MVPPISSLSHHTPANGLDEPLYDDATSDAAPPGIDTRSEETTRTRPGGRQGNALQYSSVAFSKRHPDLPSGGSRTRKGTEESELYTAVDQEATLNSVEPNAAREEEDDILVDVSEFHRPRPKLHKAQDNGGLVDTSRRQHSPSDDYAQVNKKPVSSMDKALAASEKFREAYSQLADGIHQAVKEFARPRPTGPVGRLAIRAGISREAHGTQSAVTALEHRLDASDFRDAADKMRRALVIQYPNNPKERAELMDDYLSELVSQAIGLLDKQQLKKFLHHATKGGLLDNTVQTPDPDPSGISRQVMWAFVRHASTLSASA